MSQYLHPDEMSEKEFELHKRGFIFNNKGIVVRHNPSILAKYIKDEDYGFIYTLDGSWYQYQESVYVEIEVDEMLKFIFDIMNEGGFGFWRESYAKETLTAMKNLFLTTKELNQSRNLINMKNGMFDIVKIKLIAHDPKYLSTIQIPIVYNVVATCPLFDRALDEWFEGDRERITKAIEWMGYVLTTNTSAQKALFLYGTGSNGKSRFLEVVTELVSPKNISNVSLVELQNNFYRATLFGKLLNVATETELGGRPFNTQYFKAIVGEDTINADRKFENVKSFKPTVKIAVSMNSFPKANDNSEGYYRRIDFLPFTAKFSGEKKDERLSEKIIKSEMSGVFNLAIKGLNQLKANGFKFSPCKMSDKYLELYKMTLNPMMVFFEECIGLAEATHREDRKKIYSTYTRWAYKNGFKTESNITTTAFWEEFNKESERRKITTKFGRSNKFRYQTGIRVITDETEA